MRPDERKHLRTQERKEREARRLHNGTESNTAILARLKRTAASRMIHKRGRGNGINVWSCFSTSTHTPLYVNTETHTSSEAAAVATRADDEGVHQTARYTNMHTPPTHPPTHSEAAFEWTTVEFPERANMEQRWAEPPCRYRVGRLPNECVFTAVGAHGCFVVFCLHVCDTRMLSRLLCVNRTWSCASVCVAV